MLNNKIIFLAFIILFMIGCAHRTGDFEILNTDYSSDFQTRITERTLLEEDTWNGILYFRDSETELEGDFIIKYIKERSFWSMNISGPVGYSAFRVRLIEDSLLVSWRDEEDNWVYYRSWEDSSYKPVIPFGDFFFSLLTGYIIGDIVKAEDDFVFLNYNMRVYAVQFSQNYLPLTAFLIDEGEEISINWGWSRRGKLENTEINGEYFEFKLYFREYVY